MANSSLYNALFSKKKQKGGAKTNVIALLYEKKTFLVKTFANLIVQLGITYYFMENTPVQQNQKNKPNINAFGWAYLFFGIAIILILAFVPMPSWLKFLLFSVFSYLTGLLLSFTKVFAGSELINVSILGTISIFAIMFAIGIALIAFGINLGINTMLFLFFSLLLLIIFKLIFSMAGQTSTINKILTVAGLIIFSVYIIYDTNKILQRDYYGDFVTASLDYYLDIINIFVNLLSLENN